VQHKSAARCLLTFGSHRRRMRLARIVRSSAAWSVSACDVQAEVVRVVGVAAASAAARHYCPADRYRPVFAGDGDDGFRPMNDCWNRVRVATGRPICEITSAARVVLPAIARDHHLGIRRARSGRRPRRVATSLCSPRHGSNRAANRSRDATRPGHLSDSLRNPDVGLTSHRQRAFISDIRPVGSVPSQRRIPQP
jgi:hypothetical protein